MVERQLVRAAFVAGVHGLAGVEDVRDLLLGFVRVFAEIPDDFDVVEILFHSCYTFLSSNLTTVPGTRVMPDNGVWHYCYVEIGNAVEISSDFYYNKSSSVKMFTELQYRVTCRVAESGAKRTEGWVRYGEALSKGGEDDVRILPVLRNREV